MKRDGRRRPPTSHAEAPSRKPRPETRTRAAAPAHTVAGWTALATSALPADTTPGTPGAAQPPESGPQPRRADPPRSAT